MKILVTGSHGYIGKHLIKMLNTEVDQWDINHPTNPIDITQRLSGEYDTIIHLAAKVRVNESVTNPTDYYMTNLFGTINLIRSIKHKNFIFASTGTASNPINPYAYSKRCAEDVIQELCPMHTIFRFYNVIGSDPYPPTNPDGLFHNLINTRPFHLYGTDYDTRDGTPERDYVHVNEICHAIIQAITKPSNSIENLGHGRGHTVKEMVEIYKRVNHTDFEVIPKPRRNGDLESSVLDNVSKYMKNLYTIEELLKYDPENNHTIIQ
jgi:UDP-glucose 4-epimerase